MERTLQQKITLILRFHCDEALACFMLRRTKQFKDAEVVRTRQEDVLSKLDAIVDVGGVYDPDRYFSNSFEVTTRFRFDHHQIGFTGTLDDKHPTKLSSAGLIYKFV